MKLYALLVAFAYLWDVGDRPSKLEQGYSLEQGGWKFLTLKTDYYRSKVEDTCPAYSFDVKIEYGQSEGKDGCDDGSYCYDTICTWFDYNGKKLDLDPYRSNPWFKFYDQDGEKVFVNIANGCTGHNMCGGCGDYGQCSMEDGYAVCICDDGWTGDYCDEKDNQTIIIAVTVLGAVLALLIVIAIVAHLCCKGHRRRPATVVVPHKPPIHGHCGPACAPPVQPIPCGPNCSCQKHTAVPSCPVHHPSVRVSEINDNGVVNNLNTFVVNKGGAYHSPGNATTYVTPPNGPTVLTNIPGGVGTAFGAQPSVSVIN